MTFQAETFYADAVKEVSVVIAVIAQKYDWYQW
jgi:hypothetical protein